MAIEDLLQQADNTVIISYLRLLAEKQLKSEQALIHLQDCQLKIDRQEKQINQLQSQVKSINTELDLLRRQSKVTKTRIEQFIVSDDGTAFDTKTGLTWCRYSIGQKWKNGEVMGDVLLMDWHEAMDIDKLFNEHDTCGGFKDWRLPTDKELETIININNNPTINQSVFPNTPEEFYWTCNNVTSHDAILVCFVTGDTALFEKNSHCAVRLVR